MEIIAFVIALMFFAAVTPMAASRKRGETQKILGKMLLDEQFVTSSVIDIGEMSLYLDRLNDKFFLRKTRTDLVIEILSLHDVTGVQVLDDGTRIFAAANGRISTDLLFSGDSPELLKKSSTCEKLQIAVYFHNNYAPDLLIPVVDEPISRRFFAYREALALTKTVTEIFAAACGCTILH
ncbi:MAG: hypothetical protein IKU55_04550 [Clostridia bacterium]|nr:hypothetical protein [Clostridia bacterium]